jgi:hypothetical protein
MALQDHLHYTDFKNKLLQQQTTLLQAKIL